MVAVINKTQAAVTAVQAIANFKANSAIPSQGILDSSANVASLLDQLRPLVIAGDIASIALTDTLPLTISNASFLSGAQVLALLPAGYTLTLTSVPAASARTIQSATNVTSFSVSDTASAITSNLDALNGTTHLKAISLTSGTMLTITASQVVSDVVALSKLPSNYQLTVTGAVSTNAASLQSTPHVVAFSVIDTAANVTANLAAPNAAGKLSSITVADIATLTITFVQLNSYVTALARLTANETLIVTGVTAAGVAAVQANARVKSFSVTDASAAVAVNLNTLNAATKLTAISLADSAPLVITFIQLANDALAIARLPSTARFMVSEVTAAAATGAQGNGRIASFGLSDTAANVVANLAALNVATKLQTITLTDTVPLALSAAQVTTFAAVLFKLPSNYGLTISGVTAAGAGTAQANAHVRSFTVSDSSPNVIAYLDSLNGYNRLASIALTDSQPLSISFTQYSNDAAALGKISTTWSAIVQGVSAVAAAGAQANTHVRNFSVNDSANAVSSNLDALNGAGKLTSIVLTGGTSTALTLTVRQLATDTTALGRIATNYQVSVSDATVSDLATLQANSHVKSIQVVDTAANISGALSVLNSNSLVTSIGLSAGTTFTVSYAQLTTYGTALGKLVTGDQLTVNGVTAPDARTVQANARVSSFNVTDTAANIVSNLNSLNADGKLSTIAISGTTALSLTYTNFIGNASALSKIGGSYTLTVSGVPAAGANLVNSNTHVSHFIVSDTIADIGAKLDQLEAAAKTGKLTSIAVTDTGGSINISQAQYSADSDAIALLQGSYTINRPAAAGHATINLVWDSRALAAPAAFRSAITYAAQYFQSLITNPITINLQVGYGEVAGSTMSNGVLGAAGPTQGIGATYAQFRNDLATHITSATAQTIFNSLPTADPSRGGSIYLASAQEKALGLMTGTNTAIDGTMGFAADPNGTLFTYDPGARAVVGKYDLIGVAEHEISHALGRIAMGGTYGSWISALDVFRYSAPGVHSPNAGGNAYFSIDGGTTNLDWFSNSSDLADWSSSAGNDANDAFSNSGVINQFTQADITELVALGFATSGTPQASTVGQTIISASSGLNAPSLSFVSTPALVFMTDDMPILDIGLSPLAGIQEIAQFEYGVDELRIDMQGAASSMFVAFDTTIGGQHAIALANSANTSRGLVLTNMPGNDTAADLMAHHVTFGGGLAIVV